jgi:hypothetical protein
MSIAGFAAIIGVADLVHGKLPATELAPGFVRQLLARVNADLVVLDERWMRSRGASTHP